MDEYQAVYNENILRRSMGQPLRTHYFTAYDRIGGPPVGGGGPYMLKANGSPIKPKWYK